MMKNQTSSPNHRRFQRPVEHHDSRGCTNTLLHCIQLSVVIAVCSAFPRRLPIGKQSEPLRGINFEVYHLQSNNLFIFVYWLLQFH